MEVWVKYVSNATICESVIFHNWKGRRLQHGQWGVALASEGLHPARATGWLRVSCTITQAITQTLLKHYCTITQTILKLYCTVAQVGLSLLYYHAPFALAFLLAIGFSVVQTTGVFFNNYLREVI